MEPTTQPTTSSTSLRRSKKRWLPWALIVLAVLAVGAAATYLLTSNQDSANEPAGAVTLDNSGFTPKTITVRQGEAITWTNNDQTAHQIKSDTLAELNSEEPIASGDSFSFVFEKAGTFNYYDPADANKFNGTVIVE